MLRKRLYIKGFRGFFICTESAQTLFSQQPMHALSRFHDLFGLCMNILVTRNTDSNLISKFILQGVHQDILLKLLNRNGTPAGRKETEKS